MKILRVLALIVIFFVLIGCVSASEDNGTQSNGEIINNHEDLNAIDENISTANPNTNHPTHISRLNSKDYNITANATDVYLGNKSTVYVFLPDDATDGILTIDGKVVNISDARNGIGLAIQISTGKYSITINYSNDTKYANKTVTCTYNVYPIKKSTSAININFNYPYYINEKIIIGFTPINSTGSIEVSINGKKYPVINNKTTIENGLASGNYTIIAQLNGDDYYESSFNITTFEVKKIDNISINISMPENIKARQYFTIDVELSQNATGIVFIDIEGLGYYGYIKNTKASISIPGLDAGNHNITVRYGGDKQYDVKIQKFNCSILKSTSAIEINVNKTYDVGDDIIISLNPINSTGNVSVTINGVQYKVVENNVTISNGLAEGTYEILAKLTGDKNFNKSQNTSTFKVESQINIIAPDVIKYYTNPERFVIVVTDKKGTVIANKKVNININAITYTKITDEDGETSIALNLNPGTYTVTTSCDNVKVKSTVKILKTVNGTDIVKTYRNSTQYYATFHDNNGNYLASGTTVKFNINGVFYERKISGNKGLARLNINLDPGKYILTAINPQSNEMSSNNITVLARFSDYKDLVKYYKNNSQYSVKVIGDDGKPVGANETVTFNINGVFYKRMTNSEGIAKLNINLNPGEYVITAEYKDSMISNNIKVLPILLTKDLTMHYQDKSKFEAKLLDGKGNPFANQNVSFNINGVLYKRPTDSNGTAKLNINLAPGIYTITSSYNGYSIGNMITIIE